MDTPDMYQKTQFGPFITMEPHCCVVVAVLDPIRAVLRVCMRKPEYLV